MDQQGKTHGGEVKSPADTLAAPSAPLHAPEAEAALLGGLLVDPSQFSVVDGIEANLFDPRHRLIFSTLKAMSDAKEEMDAVKLKARLELGGRLTDAGGAEYLLKLIDGCGRPGAVAEYAAIISEYARRRTAQVAARRYLDALGRGDMDAEAEALKVAIEGVSQAAGDDPYSPRMLFEVRIEAEELRKLPRIPTSIPGLDDAIGGGYLPRWTVIFGAFVGGGKTMLAVREAVHHASQGRPVLIISLELSAPEIVFRLDNALDQPGIELPVWIWAETVDLDAMTKTIRQWVTALRLTRPDVPTPIVIIDYIQLVQASSKQQTREREVAVSVQALQRLARKLKFVLIAGAQFNRNSQNEERPELHHLRESGQIEQSADLAILMAKDGNDRMWLKVGKSRWSGAGKEFDLSCDFAKCRLGVLEDREKFKDLVAFILNYLRLHGGAEKMKNICNGIKWEGRHPRKYDIYDAAMTTNEFTAHGVDVKLAPTADPAQAAVPFPAPPAP